MTGGPPDAEVVAILRKLYFYNHVHIPDEGVTPGGLHHFVKFHGILSEDELAKLKDWLSNGEQKGDNGDNQEPTQ